MNMKTKHSNILILIILIFILFFVTGCETVNQEDYSDFQNKVYFELEFVDSYTIDWEMSEDIFMNNKHEIDKRIYHIESSRKNNEYKYYLYGKREFDSKVYEFKFWYGTYNDDKEYVCLETNFNNKTLKVYEAYDDYSSAYPMKEMSLPTLLDICFSNIMNTSEEEDFTLKSFFNTYTAKKTIKTLDKDGKMVMKFKNSLFKSFSKDIQEITAAYERNSQEQMKVDYDANITIPNLQDFTFIESGSVDYSSVVLNFIDIN